MTVNIVVAFPTPPWVIINKGGVRGKIGGCQTIYLKVGRLIFQVGKGNNYCFPSEVGYYDKISGRDYCVTRE